MTAMTREFTRAWTPWISISSIISPGARGRIAMALELYHLKPGLAGSADLLVGVEHTAPSIGSGLVPVLATPVMINVIEAAALAAVEHLLPSRPRRLYKTPALEEPPVERRQELLALSWHCGARRWRGVRPCFLRGETRC